MYLMTAAMSKKPTNERNIDEVLVESIGRIDRTANDMKDWRHPNDKYYRYATFQVPSELAASRLQQVQTDRVQDSKLRTRTEFQFYTIRATVLEWMRLSVTSGVSCTNVVFALNACIGTRKGEICDFVGIAFRHPTIGEVQDSKYRPGCALIHQRGRVKAKKGHTPEFKESQKNRVTWACGAAFSCPDNGEHQWPHWEDKRAGKVQTVVKPILFNFSAQEILLKIDEVRSYLMKLLFQCASGKRENDESARKEEAYLSTYGENFSRLRDWLGGKVSATGDIKRRFPGIPARTHAGRAMYANIALAFYAPPRTEESLFIKDVLMHANLNSVVNYKKIKVLFGSDMLDQTVEKKRAELQLQLSELHASVGRLKRAIDRESVTVDLATVSAAKMRRDCRGCTYIVLTNSDRWSTVAEGKELQYVLDVSKMEGEKPIPRARRWQREVLRNLGHQLSASQLRALPNLAHDAADAVGRKRAKVNP